MYMSQDEKDAAKLARNVALAAMSQDQKEAAKLETGTECDISSYVPGPDRRTHGGRRTNWQQGQAVRGGQIFSRQLRRSAGCNALLGASFTPAALGRRILSPTWRDGGGETGPKGLRSRGGLAGGGLGTTRRRATRSKQYATRAPPEAPARQASTPCAAGAC
jgi:hypothetical protein